MIFVLQIAAGVALGTLVAEAANLILMKIAVGWAMKRADRWLKEEDEERKRVVVVKKTPKAGSPRGFWH